MKFLKLKFSNARLIRGRSDKNRLGYNRFFHPINKMHIYNSLCVLLDRTPKPQLRETDDKFMPFYEDVMSVVNKGFIKTNLITENETITIIKKDWNSNLKSAKQYTWVDCKYTTGTLFPIFLYQISQILDKSEKEVLKISFDEVIESIQLMGHKNDNEEFEFLNQKIIDLLSWCARNSSTVITNYIKSKQESSRPTGFGKKVNRGIVDASIFEGVIYIPLSQELFEEMIKYTKGHSTILDGGLVKIMGYSEIYEDDLIDFVKIDELNLMKKFNKSLVRTINWSDTIYNRIDLNNLERSIKKIIKDLDIDIDISNKVEYNNMIKKVKSIKDINVSKVGYKLNFFIENEINKKYKQKI